MPLFRFPARAVLVSNPASLAVGALENDTAVSAIAEQNNMELIDDLGVDVISPGYYASLASLTPGDVAAGTIVSDVLLHADPIVSTGTYFRGSLTVDGDILGVILLTSKLNAADSILGLPDATYYQGNSRGLELGCGDSIFVSDDRSTLTFIFTTFSLIDEVRVVFQENVTARSSISPIPEPATGNLIGFATLSLAGLRRFQSRRPAVSLTTARFAQRD